MWITVAVTAIVFLVAAAITYRIIVRAATERATAEARSVAAQTLAAAVRTSWPHPLVGRIVAHRNDPTTPVGYVVHVDASNRVRIRRPNETVIRRKIDSIVPLASPHYVRPVA